MTNQRLDDADLGQLFRNNQAWAQRMRERDANFFDRLAHQQSPKYTSGLAVQTAECRPMKSWGWIQERCSFIETWPTWSCTPT